MAESHRSTNPRSWRHWRALVTTDGIVLHNLIVGAGTITAGLFGAAFQSLVSRSPRQAEFGSTCAVVSIAMVVRGLGVLRAIWKQGSDSATLVVAADASSPSRILALQRLR
jgi:hypothetical protein